MHVKSKFTPCQNRVNGVILAALNSLLLEIPADLKSCGEYALVKACLILLSEANITMPK